MIYLAEPNQRYDLTTLEDIGDIVYASAEPVNPFNTERAMTTLRNGLKDFNPDEDMICLTGNMQTVSMLLAVACRKYDAIRVLLFDARSSNYKERIMRNV